MSNEITKAKVIFKYRGKLYRSAKSRCPELRCDYCVFGDKAHYPFALDACNKACGICEELKCIFKQYNPKTEDKK